MEPNKVEGLVSQCSRKNFSLTWVNDSGTIVEPKRNDFFERVVNTVSVPSQLHVRDRSEQKGAAEVSANPLKSVRRTKRGRIQMKGQTLTGSRRNLAM